MTSLLWLALACGFLYGACAGLARLLWEAAREGYARGYRRVVGGAQVLVEEEDD